MATTNERTVPIPEREEIEKYAHSVFNKHIPRESPEIRVSKVYEFAMDVAAFSARRTREKAIEECLSAIEKVKPLIGPCGESRGQVNSFHKKLSGLNLAIAQIKSLTN